MTNITFIFETSPNTKPNEKKVGGTWHIMPPPVWKSGGDTSPVSPTKLRPCTHDISWPNTYFSITKNFLCI